MKKTAREWFEQLPEPIRSQAINNGTHLHFTHSSLADALLYEFTWIETSEGVDYWEEIYLSALNDKTEKQ